jgi:hypothetical protein
MVKWPRVWSWGVHEAFQLSDKFSNAFCHTSWMLVETTKSTENHCWSYGRRRDRRTWRMGLMATNQDLTRASNIAALNQSQQPSDKQSSNADLG